MNPLSAIHIPTVPDITDLGDDAWLSVPETWVGTYWSGHPAPEGRWFSCRLLWSDSHLYIRFDARQHEPLVVHPEPITTKKTIGLWERDVCELFIAPDPDAPHRYFEFELAPTGEWLDLAIEVTPGGRNTEWEYASGMSAAAVVAPELVTLTASIPFASLGHTPRPGETWLGNAFRCVGSGPDRGYLAWCPTLTPVPSFHVPGAFGKINFT
jgi:hypothetical protein